MSGVAVVAGIFPPGSVVVLTKVESERVLRPEGGEEIERRIVDERGNVGFGGLEIGARYFASGYLRGVPVDVRLYGVDSTAPDSGLAQAPVQPTVAKIGTQEDPDVPPPPEPPAAGPLEAEQPEGDEAPSEVPAFAVGVPDEALPVAPAPRVRPASSEGAPAAPESELPAS